MRMHDLLNRLEQAGNRLPAPTVLFIYLTAAVLVLSAVAHWLGLSAVHPVTGNTLHAVNLLNQEGIHRILKETVTNFTQFAPVGTVLVAVLGMSIAEHSGLLGTVLRATVLKAPAHFLTFTIVACGVLSSLATDTGYVILIPLAGMIFRAAGRNPLTGIAAAFAGVSGGYSANLIITPVDAMLAGITTEAAQLIAPGYQVHAAANYYFMIASTAMIALVGTWVTQTLVAPRLEKIETNTTPYPLAVERSTIPAETPTADHALWKQTITTTEQRALMGVGLYTVLCIGLILWGLLPSNGLLRDAQTGQILQSPFMSGIVTLISLYAAGAGILYGKLSGQYRHWGNCVAGMEQHMATMGSYLVLMFFAAQFVSYFAWSNLGGIIAIQGAQGLRELALPGAVVLILFILLTAFINLFIGSASAKWALIAPVFVPMFLLAGLTPEAAQVAYRVGDSSTNIISPLMPYFGVVIAFAQQYRKDLGIGSLVAMMLPYSIVFLFSWSCLLGIWIALDLPLGPGAAISLAP